MGEFTYEDLKSLSKNNPKTLANDLSFEDGILLAKEMLNNNEWDEVLQEYAASLLEELKKISSSMEFFLEI